MSSNGSNGQLRICLSKEYGHGTLAFLCDGKGKCAVVEHINAHGPYSEETRIVGKIQDCLKICPNANGHHPFVTQQILEEAAQRIAAASPK